MKRTYQLKNLDCPTCAALMEESIRSVKGIESASISFMTGRMVLEGDIDASVIAEVKSVLPRWMRIPHSDKCKCFNKCAQAR